MLFYAGYVETFSDRCRQYLPANHLVFTVTRTFSSSSGSSAFNEAPLHIDPRMGDKYNQYWEWLPNREAAQLLLGSSNPMVKDLAAMDDAKRFVATEGCSSASVRQFRENLIRASYRQASLQQEQGLTPVVAFLNACLSFYHDRLATMRPWCQCLHTRYGDLMTPPRSRPSTARIF